MPSGFLIHEGYGEEKTMAFAIETDIGSHMVKGEGDFRERMKRSRMSGKVQIPITPVKSWA